MDITIFDTRLQDLEQFRLDYLEVMGIDENDVDEQPTDEGLLEYFNGIIEDEEAELSEQFMLYEQSYNFNGFLLIDRTRTIENQVLVTEYLSNLNELLWTNVYMDKVITINSETDNLQTTVISEIGSKTYDIVGVTENLSEYVIELLEYTKVELDEHIEKNIIKLGPTAREYFAK